MSDNLKLNILLRHLIQTNDIYIEMISKVNKIWERKMSGQNLPGLKSAIKYLGRLENAADSLNKQIELIDDIKIILKNHH